MHLTWTQANDSALIKELASQALCSPVLDIRPIGGHISYNYEVNHNTIFKLPGRRTAPQ